MDGMIDPMIDHRIRINEGCSLYIRVPTGYDAEIAQKCREITDLLTEPEKRGQGWAKMLMKQVCDEADQAKMSLILHCDPSEKGIVSARLRGFYESFGFVVFQNKPCLMVRKYG